MAGRFAFHRGRRQAAFRFPGGDSVHPCYRIFRRRTDERTRNERGGRGVDPRHPDADPHGPVGGVRDVPQDHQGVGPALRGGHAPQRHPPPRPPGERLRAGDGDLRPSGRGRLRLRRRVPPEPVRRHRGDRAAAPYPLPGDAVRPDDGGRPQPRRRGRGALHHGRARRRPHRVPAGHRLRGRPAAAGALEPLGNRRFLGDGAAGSFRDGGSPPRPSRGR